MSGHTDEVILRRYLLADLDEEERERVEERLFSDEGFAEELVCAEASLVDDYALKVLPQRDCDLFEQNFILTDERRKNLVFARAVNAYIEEEVSAPAEPERPSWWTTFGAHKSWAAATALAGVLLIILVPIMLTWFGSSNRERMQRRVAELNHQSPSSETQPAIGLRLEPVSLLRSGGELKQIQIGKDIKVLNLELALPSVKHSKYSFITRTVEGEQLFTLDDLSPNADAVILVKVPTEFLPTNDYQFEIRGVVADGSSTSVGLYHLRIIDGGR